MSFYLKKSIRVGPIRFNLSKSGIKVSSGGQGFLVGTGACGNYVHMGAGGVHYRKIRSSGQKVSSVNQLAGAQDAGPCSQMVQGSSEELLHELNTKRALVRWWPGVLVGCVGVFLSMIIAGLLPVLPLLWFLLSVPAVIWTYKRDVLRKTVVLLYEFDPVLEQAYGDLHSSASFLGQCKACWHISRSGSVHDSKYHAGASSLVDRKETKIRAKSPDFLETNVKTIAVDVGNRTFYLFPDRLLIYDEGKIGSVGYDEINVQVQQTRFVENTTPPRDAHIVDRTWRYVNKNGSPDKRFANNVLLPVCLYDEIHLSSRVGLNEVFQVSRYGVGISFAESIRSLGRRARLDAGEQGVAHGPGIPATSGPPSIAHTGGGDTSPIPPSPIEQRIAQGFVSPPPAPARSSPAPSLKSSPPDSPPAEIFFGKGFRSLDTPEPTPRFVQSPPPAPPPTKETFREPSPPPLPPARPVVYAPPTPPAAPTERLLRVPDVVSAIRPPEPKKLQWVPSGTWVQIAGRKIPGMVYTCKHALGVESEPSAIFTTANVGQHRSHSEDLSYYPSYSSLTPAQRGFYLDWLASGRRDANPGDLPTGYLFLFFYGIERRILVDGNFDSSLWLEVLELMKIYGLTRKSRSIASYFGDFLHFTSYAAEPERYNSICQMLFELQGKRTSEIALTLALANHYRTGTPVGWSLAHMVAMNHDDSRRSVVAERTGEAFKGMFRKKFEALYPEGMMLKAAKRDQTVQYQTGNYTINPRFGNSRSASAAVLKVPGVMGLKSQFKSLPVIWNQCIEDLSGYSRAVTKLKSAASVTNQDRLKAHLALPPEIRSERPHPLAAQFGEALQACPETNGIRFMPVAVLAGLLGIGEREALTQGQSDEVADLVESLCHTIAPQPQILNLPLIWTQEVAIAPCPGGAAVPKELGGLLRLLYLAVLIASADGVVDETELEVFHRATGLMEGFARIQIEATEAALTRDTHVASKQLLRIAKSVHQAERMAVFKLLVHIACVDGVLSSDENRMLRRIAKAFQLGEEALNDVLTEDSAFQTVTVSRGKPRASGEAIPQADEPVASSFSLDMDRIAALTAETAEVVSILSKALAEESHEEPVEPVTEPVAAVPSGQVGIPDWADALDPRYHSAFLDLIALPEGQAPNMNAIAGKHLLMADDLIDGVNAWSDEALGDFLIEIADDDQISIRRELLPTH
jgi:uncharacterized tellurite resistance protein B-like protein